jgi:chloramphenicol-sensitive protein RarD
LPSSRLPTESIIIQAAESAARRGTLAAASAFVIWGLFPLYLKPLAEVPALQILAHRTLWCALFVCAWLAVRGQLGEVRAAFRDRTVLARLALCATLITINWLVYVWAIAQGRVLDTSLGYFINPLLNVVLGVLVLSERLSRAQWLAVAIVAAGVAWLTFAAGSLPWIALVLASSFGAYGLVRKMAPVGAVPGLAVETLLLAPFALGWLVMVELLGVSAFLSGAPVIDVMLFASGLMTALPLALFATGARLIPYSLLGILQYIGPTLQFTLGLAVFGESFSGARAVGFGIIWAGIAVFLFDGLKRSRR